MSDFSKLKVLYFKLMQDRAQVNTGVNTLAIIRNSGTEEVRINTAIYIQPTDGDWMKAEETTYVFKAKSTNHIYISIPASAITKPDEYMVCIGFDKPENDCLPKFSQMLIVE